MTEIISQQGIYSKDKKPEEVQHSDPHAPKPLFNVDPLTNNNEDLYKNLINIDEADLDLVEGTVIGSVVNIIKDGLILFVPMDVVYRLFCPNKFIRNKSEIRLGDWFVCQAVAIKPKGESEITGQKLLASHIVIKEIEPFAMKDQFPDWQQRQYGGIFEILVRLPVSFNRLTSKRSIFHIEKDQLRLFETEYSFKVLMPEKRFYSFYDTKAFRLAPNEERIFEFWATLGKAIQFKGLDDKVGYCCMRVLNSTPIYEVLADGSRRDVGRAQKVFVCHTNTTTGDLDPCENKSDEVNVKDKPVEHKEKDELEPKITNDRDSKTADDRKSISTIKQREELMEYQARRDFDREVAETEKTMQRMFEKRYSQQELLKAGDGTLGQLEEVAQKLRAYSTESGNESAQESELPSYRSSIESDVPEDEPREKEPTVTLGPSTSNEQTVLRDVKEILVNCEVEKEDVFASKSNQDAYEDNEQYSTPNSEPDTDEQGVSFDEMLASMSIMLSYPEVQEAAVSQGLTEVLERIQEFIER